MKQYTLPFASICLMITGCASAPKHTPPVVESTTVLNQKTNHQISIETRTRSGEVKTISHDISSEDSTVIRPKVLTPSNATVGEAWWVLKHNFPNHAIEKSSLQQNTDMGLQQARQAGLDGDGVVVAVLDTGIDSDEIKPERIIESFGSGMESEHGSQVAHLIAGDKNGIAPNVKLIEAKHNTFSVATSRSMVKAANHAPIINYSGNSSHEADGSQEALDEGKKMLPAFSKAIKEHGALIVQSVGNDGRLNPNAHAHILDLDKQIQQGLVLVTAANSTKDKTLASKDLEVWANACGKFEKHCMTAPGYYTARYGKDAFTTIGGTSYAAPRVTGTAALIKQKFPWASNDVIRTSLLTTADDLGDKSKYGWGMLNIAKAVKGPASLPFGKLTTEVSDGIYSFENDISGKGSLHKTGVGTLNLDGINTFSGGIDVESGVLNINRSYTGTARVAQNATLGGEGIVRHVVSTGGTVDFQDGLAVINLKLDDNSTTKVRLGRTAKVEGHADLAGVLHIGSVANKLDNIPKQAHLALSINSKKGAFKQVTSPVLYDVNAVYHDQGVDVVLSKKDADKVATMIKQQTKVSDVALKSLHTAAKTLDVAVANNQDDDLVGLYNQNQLNSVVESLYSLNNSVYGNSFDAMRLQLGGFNSAIKNDVISKTDNVDGFHVLTYAGTAKNKWSPSYDIQANNQQHNYGLGVLYQQDNKAISAVVSKHGSNWQEKFNQKLLSKAHNQSVGLQLQGVMKKDDVELSVGLANFNIKNNVNRQIDLSDSQHQAKAKQDNRLLQAFVQANYNLLNNDGLSVQLQTNVRLDKMKLGGFHEDTSTDMGIKHPTVKDHAVAGTVGLKLSKQMDNRLINQLDFSTAIEHDLKQHKTTDGAWGVAKTRYLADMGLGFKLTDNINGRLNINHMANNAYKDTSATMGVSLKF